MPAPMKMAKTNDRPTVPSPPIVLKVSRNPVDFWGWSMRKCTEEYTRSKRLPLMKKTLSLLALSLVCSGGLAAQAPPKDPKASDVRTRDIYVSVVNDKGEAATGLTAADFSVREAGAAREVLRAGPAVKPLDVTF